MTQFSAVSPDNSLVYVSDTWRALILKLQIFKTQPGVPCLVQRSLNSIKNNERKPWSCIYWKQTSLHQSLIVKSQQNIIEFVTIPLSTKPLQCHLSVLPIMLGVSQVRKSTWIRLSWPCSWKKSLLISWVNSWPLFWFCVFEKKGRKLTFPNLSYVCLCLSSSLRALFCFIRY